MALFDKLKDAAGKTAETASNLSKKAGEEYNKIKAEAERKKEEAEKKKAEEAALDAQNKALAAEAAAKLVDEIKAGFQGTPFYETLAQDEIQKFAKEFYDKMVLPGSKSNLSCLLMYPHIPVKKLAFIKNITGVDLTETPLIYVKDQDSQEFLVTKENIYFKRVMEDLPKYWCMGSVPMQEVHTFGVEIGEAEGMLQVNGVAVAKMRICNTYRQDFMALNRYVESIHSHDYVITNEEIDQLIRQKIGDKIYEQVKKYMTYDDELLMFYAGGLDSLLATDYIACTTKQIIIVNREMLGATANVKQFYYEDITSMATEQNTKSDDLFVAIIDTALTAALKVCNLIITVSGSRNQIDTLYTVEAERVIAIYHQERKNIKQASQQPVAPTIIQQQSQPDVLEQLEKLAKLKDAGILTEEEFAQKKADLLAKL